MTSPPTFDLIDQPWIRVRTLDGAVEERSLRATLTSAAEIRGLAGEVPTQDAAMLRMLLAVLLSATRPRYPRSENECLDLFEDWWARGALPQQIIDDYLARVRDRFDLLHPQTPFYQVAGLTTATGEHSGLAKLIADVPDGIPFFTTRAGREVLTLRLSEAARWLVHCQSFDPAGIKTGALGDSRVKMGKGYSLWDPAWAGTLGLVIVEGASLFETLLLNLPLMMTGPEDLPVWERPPLGPWIEATHPLPTGPADAFTWPSRRLRLFGEGGFVHDCQISNGDKLSPQDLHHVEPMSGWKIRKSGTRGDVAVMIPVRHAVDRRVWQGLESLLGLGSDSGLKPAFAIEWLAMLRNAGVVSPRRTLDVWTIGLQYDSNRSKVEGATEDRLLAPVASLTDAVLVQAAVDAAAQAARGVNDLANLAGNLDRAAGADGNARARTFTRTLEVGFALLDEPFRGWIRTLEDPAHVAEYRGAWSGTAYALLRSAGDDRVADAGPAALVGRRVNRLDSGTAGPPDAGPAKQWIRLDAGLAQLRFRSALAKAFPQPKPNSYEGTQ